MSRDHIEAGRRRRRRAHPLAGPVICRSSSLRHEVIVPCYPRCAAWRGARSAPHPLDRSGFPGRVPGDVAALRHGEVRVARVEPADGRVGRERLPLGDGVGGGLRNGVGRRLRGCDFSLVRRCDLAGREQQAAQEEGVENGRDVMASFTSGSWRG